MLGLASSLSSPEASKKKYILDNISGVEVAYSLRRLKTSYTGPACRVRRTSDDAELDIFFSGNTIDTATLESFCSGTDGRIARWYNQAYGDTVPLLDTSFGSDAAIALSTRRLDSTYTGPCMSVDGSSPMVGMKLTQDQLGGFANSRIRKQLGSGGDYATFSAETVTASLEVYVDAPSRGTDTSTVTILLGRGGTPVGLVKSAVVAQKTWTKVDIGTGDIGDQEFQVYLNNSTHTYKTGDQFFIRNLRVDGASSYYVPTYDDAADDGSSAGYVQPSGTGELRFAYDVGFDSQDNLEVEKLEAFSSLTNEAVIKVKVNDTDPLLGSARDQIGIRKEDFSVSNSAVPTCTFEVYADCPSILGETPSVKLQGQFGSTTRNCVPSSVPQRRWTKVTIDADGNATDSGILRIYFAGQNANLQTLKTGDHLFFRNIKYDHPNTGGTAVSYSSDFSSGLQSFVSINTGGSSGGGELADSDISNQTAQKGALVAAKWYDQSGNSRDAAQTTYSEMPLVFRYDSDKDEYCVNETNDKPAVGVGSDRNFAATAFAGNTSTGFSLFLAGQRLENRLETDGSAVAGQALFSLQPQDGAVANVDQSFEVLEVDSFSSTFRAYGNGVNFAGNTSQAYSVIDFDISSSQRLIQNILHLSQKVDKTSVGSLNGANDGALSPETDSSATTTSARENHVPYTHYVVGNRINSSGTLASDRDDNPYNINEIVFYDEDQSSNAPSIKNNLNDHYRTYSANDLVESTPSEQPGIVSSGSIKTSDGLPYVDFGDPAGDENFDTAKLQGFPDISQPLTIAAVANLSQNYERIIGRSGGGTLLFAPDNETHRLIAGATLTGPGASGTSTGKGWPLRRAVHVAVANGTSSLIRVNGQSRAEGNAGSGSSITNANSYAFSRSIDGVGATEAYELIIFSSDLSAQAALRNLEDDMQKRYSTAEFDAPLNQSYGSNCVAAWSLRKVNQNYTGPAIRVRNAAGTERDIFFTRHGHINVEDVEGFANGAELHVTRWFDQSGFGRDLTEDSVDAQPTLTDSSGNITVAGTRPSVDFANGGQMVANYSALANDPLHTYVHYQSTDDRFLMFHSENSGGGKFSWVADDDSTETNLESSYGGEDIGQSDPSELFVNGTKVSISGGSTTRDDLHTAMITNGAAYTDGSIEVHEGETSNWTTGWGISNYSGTAFDFDGVISEIMIFNVDKSSNRSDLVSNMNAYYNTH